MALFSPSFSFDRPSHFPRSQLSSSCSNTSTSSSHSLHSLASSTYTVDSDLVSPTTTRSPSPTSHPCRSSRNPSVTLALLTQQLAHQSLSPQPSSTNLRSRASTLSSKPSFRDLRHRRQSGALGHCSAARLASIANLVERVLLSGEPNDADYDSHPSEFGMAMERRRLPSVTSVPVGWIAPSVENEMDCAMPPMAVSKATENVSPNGSLRVKRSGVEKSRKTVKRTAR